MPLRQTIGLSLALLMVSTGAMAKAPEKSTSYEPSQPANAGPDKSENRSTKSRSAHRASHFRWPSRLVFHRGGRVRSRHAASYSADAGLQYPGSLVGVRCTRSGYRGDQVKQPEVCPRRRPYLEWRTARHGYADRRTSLAAAGLLRQSHRPRQRPLGDSQDQRSRPVQSPLYYRPVATRRRRAGDAACRGGGGRRRAAGAGSGNQRCGWQPTPRYARPLPRIEPQAANLTR